MTLCSNNGSLLTAGVAMDPYSSSFIRPDPSSAGTERIMHCGPVQGGATVASPAEFQSTERDWLGGDQTAQKEGMKKDDLASVPYPLSSLQKLVDSVPCKDSRRSLSMRGSPLYDGRLGQATLGTAMAPSTVESLRSGHGSFVKHHHISIVELPESSLRIKKSQSCDDSSSTKTEIEELEQFSEGEENALDNSLDLSSDFTFGNGLTGGSTMPFSTDNPAMVPQQSRTKNLTGHSSMDNSVPEPKNMDTSSSVVNKDGTAQLGLRSKRRKKAETVVEKAASIVGNRGNDDVDDLVAFINSTSEEEKTSALKKNRKTKVKQSKPSPPQRSDPDQENHQESSLDKPRVKSPENAASSQKSKSKIVPLPSKDIIDVDKTNNNDILESGESQPNSNTCTSNTSHEDKTGRPQIVNRGMPNKEQDVLGNVQNCSVEPKRENNKPKLSNSGTVENVLQDDTQKCSELRTQQAPLANDRKAEIISTRGNHPKPTKQSKPPIGTLISSRLLASSNNSNKHRPFKQQQQTQSSKKIKSESEISSKPGENVMDSEKRQVQNKHYETREKKTTTNPSATQVPPTEKNGSEEKSQDQNVPYVLKSEGEGRAKTTSSQTQHLESHQPVTRSNAKKMGETAHDHQPHSMATLKEIEGLNFNGTEQQAKDSGFQNCNSPRLDSNQQFHPDPISETQNNYHSSEIKQQQVYNGYSVAGFVDSRKPMESSSSQAPIHQETNGYPRPLITPDQHQLQDYRFRHMHPQHISHKPMIRSIEVHNNHAQKFLPDIHQQRFRKEHTIHPFRPHAPHRVPPTNVQFQLQQQALQDVHFRSLQLYAAQKQPQYQMPNVLRNGNQILPSDPCETLPQLGHQEGTQQMGPVSTSTKDVSDVHHFQHNTKIQDEKRNQFNMKEVVNFLRQEWDLVSNENLSNRPVYFNSN